jgi:Fe2+ transport system protein FeoA
MSYHSNIPEFSICNPDCNGRILNSDHYGRSFNADRQNLLSFRRIRGVYRVSVLSDLKVGETGILVGLDLPESVQNHLMHMGFVPDAEVTVLRRAPAGDPIVYSIDGLEIALRHETAESIRVRTPESESASHGGLHLATPTHTPELLEVGR